MGAMTSDSATLLALVLERRFGTTWFKRWLLVEDMEMRWLAVYLIEEASKGRVYNQATLPRAIAEGRDWLPAATRTARSAEVIVAALRTGQLLPPSGHDRLAGEQGGGDEGEVIPYL